MDQGRKTYESPLGPLTLEARGEGLTRLRFPDDGPWPELAPETPILAEATLQLDEYFAGERREFDLALDLGGTDLQRAVWAELRRIPCGTTSSYGELARAVGHADHVRAVGGAVARTPVPIVVPCHRVIGADGSLTGYLGGLDRKRTLLELERGVVPLLS